MLKTNLATRPFYNERAVQFVLGVLAVWCWRSAHSMRSN
jgi:hypothetical protein